MPFKNHLDEFNIVILYLWNLGIEDKDQALILLCSLPLSYDIFIDILLYKRDSLILKDVKGFLNSSELKKWGVNDHDDDHEEGLIMRGIINNKGSSNGGMFKSKSKSRKIKCFECYEVEHFRKNYHK
jgi:hypothetical protein